MRRSTLTRLAKIVLSVALLAAIVAHVGPRAVAVQLGSMDKALVALALALLVCESLVRALNWYQLICSGARRVALRTVAYAHFVGGFFGALLPSTLGTDVARSAIGTTRSKLPVEAWLATTVLLNVLSLAVIAALALIACLWAVRRPDAPVATLLVSAAISASVLLAVVASWARARGPGRTRTSPAGVPGTGKLKKRLQQFLAALVMLPRGWKMASVSLVATLSYALRSLGWLVLLAAAGAQISWAALLTIGPLITLGAVLPISVLGFGGFQAISVFLLAQWGVPPEQALAVSLVQSGLAVLLHGIGCVTYVAGGRVSLPALAAADRPNEKYPA
ncbi:MAG: lysylphosphatidylglycerol synthase transmembrane domain-containing protein [Woeseia sp.]